MATWPKFPRPGRFIVIVAAFVAVVGGTSQNVAVAHAAGGGGITQGTTAGGYISQQILNPAQQAEQQSKSTAVSQWISSDSAYAGQGATQGAGSSKGGTKVTPYCVVNPSTGQCSTWITVSASGGGEYTIEPNEEPNWCGPGAGTAVAMHWNYSGVVNHGSYTVRADPSWGGYNVTYSGGQGWMGWLAQGVYISQYSQNGVQPYPSTGAGTGQLADGLDAALGTSYYITIGYGGDGQYNTSAENSLFGNATYDIGHDNHPMIFLVNAQYLPEWSGYATSRINHYIMGYAYGYWNGASSNSTNRIYYADSASGSDGSGIAGDYSLMYDQFYQQPFYYGYMVIVV